MLLSACSDPLKNALNPYGNALEEYPEKIMIPAEGGTFQMVFESNFQINYYLCGYYIDPWMKSYWLEPDMATVVNEAYYQKVCISLTADSNTTGTERTDTLQVYYRHPSIILPLFMEDIIGEYCIVQSTL